MGGMKGLLENGKFSQENRVKKCVCVHTQTSYCTVLESKTLKSGARLNSQRDVLFWSVEWEIAEELNGSTEKRQENEKIIRKYSYVKCSIDSEVDLFKKKTMVLFIHHLSRHQLCFKIKSSDNHIYYLDEWNNDGLLWINKCKFILILHRKFRVSFRRNLMRNTYFGIICH